jgi:carbamoyltransferase
MGLAPYGEPKYVDLIKDNIAEVRADGSLRMNQEFFSYSQGLRMTNRAFDKLLGGPPRKAESRITQREMDLAASIQVITEEVMIKMVNHVQKQTGLKKLCLAGGVALNCVANGRILRETNFEDIWIQPAAGDAGGSVGIALVVWHRYLGNPRTSAEQKGTWRSPRSSNGTIASYEDGMKGSFLGPRNTDEEIRQFLDSQDIPYKKYSREE